MHASTELPVMVGAVGMAREVISRVLGDSVTAQGRIEDTQLLTSELVTNALRHAGLKASDTIGLAVDVTRERIRVEVADGGPGFEPPAPPDPAAIRGWGLLIVDEIADGWGVTRSAPNVVWFEILIRMPA